MPFRVDVNGITVVCDTAQEAVQLQRELQAAVGQAKPPIEVSVGSSSLRAPPVQPAHADPPTGFRSVLAHLTPHQRKAMEFIRVIGQATLQDLSTELEFGDNALKIGGVMAGIARKLSEAGVPPEAVLVRTESGSGKNRIVTYRPGPLLREIKEDLVV